MGLRKSLISLVLFVAAAAVFVWHTAASLPPLVASHFAASGMANGFMPREMYVVVLMCLVVGAPLLVAFVPFVVIHKQATNLNIPNREYWLAPERREQTISYLQSHGIWFAALVAAFLTYVHWLVVQANLHQPPVLSNRCLIFGLVVFFAMLVIWLVLLFRRFSKRT